jgi:hypothetical protein
MAVNIFFCYAREDEEFLNKLKKYLQPLQRQGLINFWYDGDILPGSEWENEIANNLNNAQIILLLVSADFLNSEFIYGVEMKRAIERSRRGDALVIPIILRPAQWTSTILGRFQALPKDAKPVTTWTNQEEAFLDIVRGIRKALKSLRVFEIEQVVHEREVRAAVSDTPKTDTRDDRLDFRPYVDALYGFITTPETTTPLVIGINGSWGSGKSSLMYMLKRQLEPRGRYYSDLLLQGLAWHVGQFGRRKLTDNQKANQKLVKERISHLRLSRFMLKRAHIEEEGKMERILEHIAKHEPMELLYYPTVWFNAGKFSEESQIWAALASEITNQLNGKEYALPTRLQFWLQLKRKRANLITALRPLILNLLLIAVLALLSVLYPSFIYPFIVSHILPFFQALFPTQTAAKGAAFTTATIGGVALFLSTAAQVLKSARQVAKAHPFKIPIKTIIETPNYQEKIGYISQFSQDFKRIVEVATRSSSPAWETQKLVIFIDDLDRCRPLQAAAVIEAISLFLDSEQCVFVLGIDMDTVAASIEAKYKELVEKFHHDRPEVVSFGRTFLEKIIQISLTIPYADNKHISQLIESLTQGNRVNNMSNLSQSSGISSTARDPNDLLMQGLFPSTILEATLADQREVRAYFQNEDVQNAIKEACRILKRNPRRIKQFINLFRLKMFLINQDVKKMNYFGGSKEKLKDFVYLLAWSMQWNEIARIIFDSPHCAEVCDYLLFLGEKYQTGIEQSSSRESQADAGADKSIDHSDIIEVVGYDPSVFDTVIEDLMDRRSKVEKFPAHWCYLPWEEWIYDNGFRFCIMHFREQWRLRKDSRSAPLLELIRL